MEPDSNCSFSHLNNRNDAVECSCFRHPTQVHLLNSVRTFTSNSNICYCFQFWFDFLLIRAINVSIKTIRWGCFHMFFLFFLLSTCFSHFSSFQLKVHHEIKMKSKIYKSNDKSCLLFGVVKYWKKFLKNDFHRKTVTNH